MKKKLKLITATLLICTLTLSGTSVTKTIASDSCVADEYTKIKNTNLDVGKNRMNVTVDDMYVCNNCGAWLDVIYDNNLEYSEKKYTNADSSHGAYCQENDIHGSAGFFNTKTNQTQIHFNQYQIEVGQ